MKIIYYFQKYDTSMYLWQITHIIDELAHHEIQVRIFNPLEYESYEQANQELIKHLRKESYDLLMTDQNKNTLFPETVCEIHKKGIPCLLIHFDNLMDPKRHIGYAPYFDAVMLLNKDVDFDYSKYKCKCVMTPYAANPYYFSDLRTTAQHKDGICFIGTPYGTRCFPINRLVHADIQVDLFANGKSIDESFKIGANLNFMKKINIALKQIETVPGRKVLKSALKCKLKPIERLESSSEYLVIHDEVKHHEMNEIYSHYSLALSMPEARNTGVLKNPINVVRLRNFEIPMCAGLQITHFYEELAEYFEEEKEIVFYRSDEELVDKVKYYTNPKNLNKVNLMKTCARKRAESDHTWYKRFTKVFYEMGILQ